MVISATAKVSVCVWAHAFSFWFPSNDTLLVVFPCSPLTHRQGTVCLVSGPSAGPDGRHSLSRELPSGNGLAVLKT